MVDLQSQLDKLQRLIELKNDQLARLEAQGAAAPQPPAGALPGEPAPPAVNAQLTPAEPVVAPAPAAADTAPQDVAAEAPASEEPGMLDQLLGNPLLVGLIAGSAFLSCCCCCCSWRASARPSRKPKSTCAWRVPWPRTASVALTWSCRPAASKVSTCRRRP